MMNQQELVARLEFVRGRIKFLVDALGGALIMGGTSEEQVRLAKSIQQFCFEQVRLEKQLKERFGGE